MQQLVLSTSNEHKLVEMRALLGDIPFELTTPRMLGIELEVEEPFLTYRENALQKARAYAKATGKLALADDSGLEIDAMDGAPGVHSARFGSPDMPYDERFKLIFARLDGIANEQRSARFRCVMALVDPTDAYPETTVEGIVEGQIAYTSRGEHGFGYDPIFWLPERQQTMAELSPIEKDAISHRGRAARQIATILQARKK
jgi:XTP/dITP diphosphohydrolase